MQTKQVVLGAVGVVALGIAGYMVFGRGSQTVSIGDRFTEHGICLSCKAESEVSYPREEAAPHRCPGCQQQAFYPWYFCFTCRNRFVPPLEQREAGGPLRLPLGVTCPKCRGTDVSPYLANQPGFESTGDLPLPKWP